jgi:hypothetical protein
MNRAGGVTCFPLVVLANVDEFGVSIPRLSFRYADFLDPALRVVDDV